jgi:transposase-like protein
MSKRVRRAFTPELKAEVVQLCQAGDRSIAQVAGDLDLTETARARVDEAGGGRRRARPGERLDHRREAVAPGSKVR